jgi:hypothetical protein
METVKIILQMAQNPGAHDTALRVVDKNFTRVMDAFPGFARPFILRIFDNECSAGDLAKVDAYIQPKLKTLGGGDLELAQAKERIGQCVALKSAKGAEIGAALAKPVI